MVTISCPSSALSGGVQGLPAMDLELRSAKKKENPKQN
jgi:hypothetical protein